MNTYKVILDLGHGGNDPGAVGPTGLTEAETVERVGLYLKNKMIVDSTNILLLLTRQPGETMSLKSRVAYINSQKPNLVVCLHCNGHWKAKAQGFEVFFNEAARRQANIMFGVMSQRLKSHVPRKVIKRNLYINRYSTAPVVYVELDFITNPVQEKIFKNENSLMYYARTLKEGILKCLAI